MRYDFQLCASGAQQKQYQIYQPRLLCFDDRKPTYCLRATVSYRTVQLLTRESGTSLGTRIGLARQLRVTKKKKNKKKTLKTMLSLITNILIYYSIAVIDVGLRNT
jgi:hypothetical protein